MYSKLGASAVLSLLVCSNDSGFMLRLHSDADTLQAAHPLLCPNPAQMQHAIWQQQLQQWPAIDISPSQTLNRRSMVLAGEVTLTLALGGACSINTLSSLSRKLGNNEVPPAMHILLRASLCAEQPRGYSAFLRA